MVLIHITLCILDLVQINILKIIECMTVVIFFILNECLFYLKFGH